jgi:hypothetical protein
MCTVGSNWSDASASPGPRSGFTLIELMVVLAGAIVPSLASAVNRQGMDRATAAVGDLLDFAAAAAVARRQPVVVQFDSQRRACRVCMSVTELPWLSEDVPAEQSVLASLRLPDGIELAVVYDLSAEAPTRWQGEGGAVRFWPDGTADEAELHLSDARGRTEIVPVRPLAGEVVLIEEE